MCGAEHVFIGLIAPHRLAPFISHEYSVCGVFGAGFSHLEKSVGKEHQIVSVSFGISAFEVGVFAAIENDRQAFNRVSVRGFIIHTPIISTKCLLCHGSHSISIPIGEPQLRTHRVPSGHRGLIEYLGRSESGHEKALGVLDLGLVRYQASSASSTASSSSSVALYAAMSSALRSAVNFQRPS